MQSQCFATTKFDKVETLGDPGQRKEGDEEDRKEL